jgi:uncharacterized coiled-coil protein SlyX
MTALFILAAYVGVGLVAGSVGLARRKGELSERLGQAALGLVLWPFLLPVFLSPGESTPPPVGSAEGARARRLEEVTRRLEECWRLAAAEGAWAQEQVREHRLLDAFVARLRAQERRIVELEAALATSPESVRERLARLHEHSVAELEHSIGLVDELAAQLTLLRFAGLGQPSAGRVERFHVEELLLRIEALAEASQPAAGAGEPPPHVARA